MRGGACRYYGEPAGRWSSSNGGWWSPRQDRHLGENKIENLYQLVRYPCLVLLKRRFYERRDYLSIDIDKYVHG